MICIITHTPLCRPICILQDLQKIIRFPPYCQTIFLKKSLHRYNHRIIEAPPDEKSVKATRDPKPALDNNEDAALQFLGDNEVGTVAEFHDSAALRRKIDLRVMPMLIEIYFLQYLDKTLLNYAAVMGIKEHLKGNEYNNLGTMYSS